MKGAMAEYFDGEENIREKRDATRGRIVIFEKRPEAGS